MVRFKPLLLPLLLALTPLTHAQPAKIYVLNVNEAGTGWIDREVFTAAFIQKLKALNLDVEVEVVRSVGDWGRLVGEGVEGVILVNAHGELVPIPSEYGGDWKAFYSKLAELVREKGWVVVNVAGLGFYYIGNSEIEDVGLVRIVGVDGPIYLALSMGVSITPMQQYRWPGPQILRYCEVSELGRRVFGVLGLDMPERLAIEWPLAMDAVPEWWLYELRTENFTAYACVAIRAGRGMLLWSGLTMVSLETKVNAAAAMVALVLDPELPYKEPRSRPLLTPAALGTLSFIVGAAVITLLLVYLVSKQLKRA